MQLIKTAKTLEAFISAIKTAGKKLDKDIQRAACSAIYHNDSADGSGDPVYINKLIAAMPAGSRINALKEWFEAFGACSWSNEKKQMVHSKKKSTLMDDAVQTSWTTFAPEPVYKGFKLEGQLHGILKKAYAKLDEGVDAKDEISKEMLDKVAEVAGYKVS